jgi:hypothetical protein
METDQDLPWCIVCRERRTGDAYELSADELDVLVTGRGVQRAERVHRKYGAVPVCRPCFEGLGFGLENDRPGETPPLVRLSPRRRDE